MSEYAEFVTTWDTVYICTYVLRSILDGVFQSMLYVRPAAYST